MRRSPQRARGQQRVSLILETAEQLFADRGYEAATTNEIAAAAGIPIGSIYQFFPNKEAILHALLAGYRADLAAAYDALATPEFARLPFAVAIERMLGVTIEYGGAHMAFSRIALLSAPGSQLAAAADTLFADVLARFEALLAARAPSLGPHQRRLYATVGLTAANAILARAISAKHAGEYTLGHDLLEQSSALLVAYLTLAIEQI